MTLVAGVDSSTQSTKVELRDAESGELAGRAVAPHPPTSPPRSEQDPQWWWTAFEDCWAELGDPTVAAIAVAGQQHGMVALDAEGEAIRPAKLWNDTESAPDAEWLLGRLEGGREAWAEACGSVPVAALTITKLAWLHRCEPEHWERLAKVLLPHDWLTYRLTGRMTTDRGEASGTGYWSPGESSYRYDLLALVDDDREWFAAVPEVLGPLDDAGVWRGAVVAPGTGDNMSAALGLGVQPGDVVISLGTSGTVYTVSEHAITDASGVVAGFADATGRYLPLACTLNATKVTEAVRRLLNVGYRHFDELALEAPPGSNGLTLLPYLDGERTPDRPAATGVLAGLRSDVERTHLARAAVEGVVCGLLDALDVLATFVPTSGRLLLTGGGAHSVAFRQILADLSDRMVTVPDLDEAVATGACLQAASVLKQEEPAEVAARFKLGNGYFVEPGPAAAAAADVRGAYAARRARGGVVPSEAVDPFAVLGLPRSADADAVRSARRRLAMAEHPDHGGDSATMQAINVAFEQAMAHLERGAPVPPAAPAEHAPATTAPPAGADGGAGATTGRRVGQRYVERDEPSFVIEALPAEAFEALLVAGTVLGEVVMDDPPYLLEVRLVDPGECWCRLELLPEAGGSTVMLTVAGVEGIAPPLDAVRDRWIETLNRLGELDR